MQLRKHHTRAGSWMELERKMRHIQVRSSTVSQQKKLHIRVQSWKELGRKKHRIQAQGLMEQRWTSLTHREWKWDVRL